MGTDSIRHLDRNRVPEATNRIYLYASLLTLLGNVFLLVVKGVVTYLSGSQALYADTINSATDVVYSLMILFVLRLAVQPADDSHPHGHGRFEPLASLAIGLMMGLAGIEAVRSAVTTLVSGPKPITSRLALLVPVITVAVKAGMYWRMKRWGQAAGSPAIRASARDNLSDILTAGVVLLGVATTEIGLPLADPLAALGVSVWIFRNAYTVLAESIRHLSGGAASPELYAKVRQAIENVPGVLGIDQLIIEYVGPQVRADIHVTMDSQTTLQSVHLVSHAVREAVEAVPGVDHAFIHPEPDERLP